MLKAITNFRLNIQHVRHLGGIRQALLSLTTAALDTSDILRAQIVLGVSALDQYVHEVTATGMVEIFSGTRPATDAFLRFKVTMEFVKNSAFVPNNAVLFESEVRERHSFLSFQHPDKIADAIRLFSSVQLWQEVAVKLAMPPADVKARLRLIVDRRNKIAHEADSDPSYPGARWPITEHDVIQTIDFIESLCEAMHSIPL